MNEKQKRVNEIFETINELCWQEKWDIIDGILMHRDINADSLEDTIAYLSITLCVKDKLKFRAKYLENAKRIHSKHPDFEQLFHGL